MTKDFAPTEKIPGKKPETDLMLDVVEFCVLLPIYWNISSRSIKSTHPIDTPLKWKFLQMRAFLE